MRDRNLQVAVSEVRKEAGLDVPAYSCIEELKQLDVTQAQIIEALEKIEDLQEQVQVAKDPITISLGQRRKILPQIPSSLVQNGTGLSLKGLEYLSKNATTSREQLVPHCGTWVDVRQSLEDDEAQPAGRRIPFTYKLS